MRAQIFLLALVACVCIEQTRADPLSAIKDKMSDLTGLGKGDEKKDEEKKDNGDLYGGGVVKQVAHTVLDAAFDRLTEEAKERSSSKLGDMAIGMASSSFKKKMHEKISNYGEGEDEGEGEKAKEEEEEKKKEEEQQKKEDEEKKDEGGDKNVLGKLVDKLSRKKRSAGSPASSTTEAQPGRLRNALHKVKSFFKGTKSAPAPAQPSVVVTTQKPATTESVATTQQPTTPASVATTQKPVEDKKQETLEKKKEAEEEKEEKEEKKEEVEEEKEPEQEEAEEGEEEEEEEEEEKKVDDKKDDQAKIESKTD